MTDKVKLKDFAEAGEKRHWHSSVQMVKKNLGWVRDTLYSKVSTKMSSSLPEEDILSKRQSKEYP